MKRKKSDRYERGRKLLGKIHGERGMKTVESLKDIAPDLVRLIYEFPYGDLWSRPGLDLKSRQLAIVAALIAVGHAGPQLKAHLRGALNLGWTQQEIVEAIMLLTVYVGFPVALNGLVLAREVFAERGLIKRRRRARG